MSNPAIMKNLFIKIYKAKELADISRTEKALVETLSFFTAVTSKIDSYDN